MNVFEPAYVQLLARVLEHGEARTCRNGETRALFGESIVIPELEKGYFPVLTQRKMHYKGVLGELAAFLRGATKLQTFKDFGCNYWDSNARVWSKNWGKEPKDMEVGQVYGAQWVNWNNTGFNQLERLLTGLYTDPFSRRHVITSFSPDAESCLPPCHLLAQFYVRDDDVRMCLDCIVYMRSVDLIHGLPSDIVLYATLLILIASHLSMQPGRLTFFLGDSHIYANHIPYYFKQQHKQPISPLPMYELDESTDVEFFEFLPSQLTLHNYVCGPSITYPFNV